MQKSPALQHQFEDRPQVRKCFELRGRTEEDLQQRVDTMREAIQVRGGAVLHVTWRKSARSKPYVSVLYQLPLMFETDEELPGSS